MDPLLSLLLALLPHQGLSVPGILPAKGQLLLPSKFLLSTVSILAYCFFIIFHLDIVPLSAFVVLGAPAGKTDKAKFMLTFAGDMTTAFILLDKHSTSRTTSEIRKNQLEISITLVFVLRKLTFWAKYHVALEALKILTLNVDQSLAIFSWAQPQARVVDCLFPRASFSRYFLLTLKANLKIQMCKLPEKNHILPGDKLNLPLRSFCKNSIFKDSFGKICGDNHLYWQIIIEGGLASRQHI